jgi:polyisoprenoid-binding protein YceI
MTNSSATSIDLSSLVRDATGEWTLDPTNSSVEFHVKHFWGRMTVHGHFDKVAGEGRDNADGSVSVQIQIAAGSVNTKNKKRDKHLRSDDFFDAERHPTITISTSGLVPDGGQDLRGPITLDTAGLQETLGTVVHVVDATADAVTLRAETSVDRTAFEMTWGPLGMTAPEARAIVTAHFDRN